MQNFDSEFHTLEYIILKSKRVLLFAHSRPDPDTVGANLALTEYVKNCGKHVDIACFDAFPDTLKSLREEIFFHPDQLDLGSYDAVIACDSVDRGFDKIVEALAPEQVVVLIDHHPNINITGDVMMIDADLVRKGAPLAKITKVIFTNKNIAALKLWGRAFEKAHFNQKNGMLVTAITKKDVEECRASVEDIYQVTSILSAVPDAKFALVLSERAGNIVRASLRSMEQHGVDVSAIAEQFGGGGHKLASGFEIHGKLVETQNG